MTGYYSKSKKQEPHSYKRIQSELAEGSLKNILLFYGREKYLIRWACGRVKETFVQPASEFFDFVRIDLYEHNDHVYFGEMTFSPASGVFEYFTDEFVSFWGNRLEISA